MGESADTVTRMLDRFERHHQPLRAELSRGERVVFDELLTLARQRPNALNRYPDLDSERVITLTMVLALATRVRHLETEVTRLSALLDERHLRGGVAP